MKTIFTLFALFVAVLINKATFAQQATAFGNNGVVISDWFGKDDAATDILVQADGKIIVVGNSVVQSHKQMIIARYLPDGNMDSTFGTNGITTTATGTVNSYAKAAALQTDGKIVVAGYYDNNFYNDAAVVRYKTDGSIDSTFGTNGIAQFLLSNQFDEFHDIAIDSNGKIVVAGRTFQNNSYDFLLIRMLGTGAPDPSFGSNGMVITDFIGSSDIIRSVIIQPDGKILVSGSTQPGSSYFAAARYLTDGSPDQTFGTGGILFIGSGNRLDHSYGMALQPDGKIVLVGTHHNNTLDEFMIVRLNANGTPDNTFGNMSTVLLPTVDPTDATQDVMIQPDGKIVLASNGSGNSALLIRLLATGVPDITFGNQGFFAGNIGGTYSALNSVIIADNNSMVACGVVKISNNDDFLVTKVLFNAPVSIQELHTGSFPVSVYPNPASDNITLDIKTVIDEKGTITIFDESGRVLMHQKFGFLYPPVKIALPESMSAGTYYLQVRTEEQSATEKFIIR